MPSSLGGAAAPWRLMEESPTRRLEARMGLSGNIRGVPIFRPPSEEFAIKPLQVH